MFMNISRQSGFTLVEMMIVVLIIGVLSAMAIPAYQSHIARSQMTEAIMLGGGARSRIAEFYSGHGRWPAAAASVLDGVSGNYVGSITLQNSDDSTMSIDIVMTMKSIGVSVDISQAQLALRTTDGGNTWACTNTFVGATKPVDARFLPKACKD